MARLFNLVTARATLVQYNFSERISVYYIKMLVEGSGFTLKTKFKRKDRAIQVVNKINARKVINLDCWDLISNPRPDYLQSRRGKMETYMKLVELGRVI